jgi:hypothetical protein
MRAPGEKIRLTAYEFMFMLGAAGDSKLSELLKNALNAEIATPGYAGLKPPQAFGKAARHLSINHPEAFLPSNRDDAMLLKLAPLMFQEDGKTARGQDVLKQIELDNVAAAAVDKGSKIDVTFAARDPGSPAMITRLSMKTKDPNRQPGE